MQAAQKEQEADGANDAMPSLDLLQVLHSTGAHVFGFQQCYHNRGAYTQHNAHVGALDACSTTARAL